MRNICGPGRASCLPERLGLHSPADRQSIVRTAQAKREQPHVFNAQLPAMLMRAAALLAAALFCQSASAETSFKPVPTQYIAALADPGANSGTGAEKWGIWRLDPGPRGVRLGSYDWPPMAAQRPPAGSLTPPTGGWRRTGSSWRSRSFPCRPANIWSPATARQKQC